jgi:hypothetical protein
MIGDGDLGRVHSLNANILNTAILKIPKSVAFPPIERAKTIHPAMSPSTVHPILAPSSSPHPARSSATVVAAIVLAEHQIVGLPDG